MFIQSPGAISPFKVVLLGDSRVGKTSLISRKTQSDASLNPKPTVGCHCSEVSITLQRKLITLQVWDTAGQEMYRALVPVYLRSANAAILVYDRTDEDSFLALTHWCSLLDDTVPPSTPVFLAANKIDLPNAVVNDDLGEQFAAKRKAHFHRISALTGDGVDELFVAIAEELSKAGTGHVDTEQKGILMSGGEKEKCKC
jgi:small GTP-binding protein